jgi:hypothetical protein
VADQVGWHRVAGAEPTRTSRSGAFVERRRRLTALPRGLLMAVPKAVPYGR